MNKLFVASSLATFSVMFREMYKYYHLKQIGNLVKTSIQVDTSFESVTKCINNRKILLACSLQNSNECQTIPLAKCFNEDIDFMPLNFNERSLEGNRLSLTNFQAKDINIKWPMKKCLYFDAPVLKSETIKIEEKLNHEKYSELSLLQKLRLWPVRKHDKYESLI